MTTELLFRDHAYLTAADCRITGHTSEGALIVDRSVFYATGGGQPGDSGMLDWEGGRMPIATTIKVEGGVALVPAEPLPMPPIGAPARMLLDWSRRYRHMRVHTALHLLSVVIPLPVTGGQVSVDRGRLDFDMPDPPGDLAAIEGVLTSLIERDLPVTEDWITDAELEANPIARQDNVGPPAHGPGPGAADPHRPWRRPDRPATLRRHPCGPHRRDRPGQHRQDREQGPPEPPRHPAPG